MAFRVGQKVVCVRRFRYTDTRGAKNRPMVGVVYTIRDIFTYEGAGETYFHLEELANAPYDFLDGLGEAEFWSKNFRPAVEKKAEKKAKAGMAILQEILDRESIEDRKPARVR